MAATPVAPEHSPTAHSVRITIATPIGRAMSTQRVGGNFVGICYWRLKQSSTMQAPGELIQRFEGPLAAMHRRIGETVDCHGMRHEHLAEDLGQEFESLDATEGTQRTLVRDQRLTQSRRPRRRGLPARSRRRERRSPRVARRMLRKADQPVWRPCPNSVCHPGLAASENPWIAHQPEAEWTRIRSMISAARGAPPLVRIESRIRSAAER